MRYIRIFFLAVFAWFWGNVVSKRQTILRELLIISLLGILLANTLLIDDHVLVLLASNGIVVSEPNEPTVSGSKETKSTETNASNDVSVQSILQSLNSESVQSSNPACTETKASNDVSVRSSIHTQPFQYSTIPAIDLGSSESISSQASNMSLQSSNKGSLQTGDNGLIQSSLRNTSSYMQTVDNVLIQSSPINAESQQLSSKVSLQACLQSIDTESVQSSSQSIDNGVIKSSPVSQGLIQSSAINTSSLQSSPVNQGLIQTSPLHNDFLSKDRKPLEDLLGESSFIEQDIKDIICRIGASAPDNILLHLKSFVSQLETTRSTNKLIRVNIKDPANTKSIISQQNSYRAEYTLEKNDLCPMVFIALPVILSRLLDIKVGDNWKDKQHFTMPELIILILKGIKNEFIPLIMKQEVLGYLGKYTPEIREFLSMCIVYMKVYKTVTFKAHRKKMYALDNYFMPMVASNYLNFSFSKDMAIDDKKASKAFYKVYMEHFHPGCLALISNIRAILTEDNVSFDGGSQNFFETAMVVYPYLNDLLKDNKITPWETIIKKETNHGKKESTKTPKKNRLSSNPMDQEKKPSINPKPKAHQKQPHLEEKDKPYKKEDNVLGEEERHKPFMQDNKGGLPKRVTNEENDDVYADRAERIYDNFPYIRKEDGRLAMSRNVKMDGYRYFLVPKLYGRSEECLHLVDTKALPGKEKIYYYISENSYILRGDKKWYPLRSSRV
jgi:hypothetical protein